jgi:hypothetical protein
VNVKLNKLGEGGEGTKVRRMDSLEERLNKDPKWLKYGAFEKCPRWRLQGWK